MTPGRGEVEWGWGEIIGWVSGSQVRFRPKHWYQKADKSRRGGIRCSKAEVFPD